MVTLVVQRGEKRKWKRKNESEFSCVFSNTSSGYGKEMDTWAKVEKMTTKWRMRKGKWWNGEIQWIKGRKRETDWELTQSGETPALIRLGSSAASGHCVGGGGDNGRWKFFDRCLTLIVDDRESCPRSAWSSSLSLKARLIRSMGGGWVGLRV